MAGTRRVLRIDWQLQNGTTMWHSIALIGFSGSGKTTTARLLAHELGWRLVDIDDQIAEHFGMPIYEVFDTHGETKFRAVESRLLERAISQPGNVIATGGGAAAQPDSWSAHLLGHPNLLTIALDAEPETVLARLEDQKDVEGSTSTRPLLVGDDPLERIRSLKRARQDSYNEAALTLSTDLVSQDQIATEIRGLLDGGNAEPSVRLHAPSGESSVFVGSGNLARLGSLTRERWPNARKAFVVSDSSVAVHHLNPAQTSLADAGFQTSTIVVSPGEGSKSLSALGDVYSQILGTGVERGDVIVALGGGVIGDLAGFVAATVLRGVGLVQAPTSLLAMVDSSIGGKTGINHPAGKNLIGAFYQPPLVIVDPDLLLTLPEREYRQGWAEIIKHGLIQQSTPGGERADLSGFLQRHRTQFETRNSPAMTYLITRNIALKARVVEADERETSIRAFLNFGHTLGHAIEASDYRYLHGEAIALGMIAAARISVASGMIDETVLASITATVEQAGLPTVSLVPSEQVLPRIGSDKKRSSGRQRWVLLDRGGGVALRDDIPSTMVTEALLAITGVEPIK